MNAQFSTFLTALGAVVASAILALALADSADTVPAAPPQAIVKLARVVIVGKAVRDADVAAFQTIEKLPRVVVTGRRADAATQVVVAQACTTSAAC